MRSELVRAAILALFAGLWTLQPVTLSSQAQRALERARAFSQRHLDDLAARKGGFAIGHHEKHVEIDDRGKSHRKVQQLYRGVPVFGGEAIVHLGEDGGLESITDDYQPVRDAVDTIPLLTPEHAVAAALAAYGFDASVLTAPPVVDLWVLKQDRDHLSYRVQLRREDGTHDTAMPVYFIDAADGRVLMAYDNLQGGTGVSLYSGTVTIGTTQSGSTFYLEDLTRKIGTFNFQNGTSNVVRVTDTNDVFDSAVQKAAVDAHYGASKVFDYYLNVHGRNGIDGNRGPAGYTAIDGVTRLLSSRVHYSTNYNNAFWNGQYMTYGDGDGTNFSPLVSLDIVGHEMTHGVIERTAGLIYSGESGALNESFADIFGAMIERSAKGESANTWKIGEEVFTPGNGTSDALRYMDNPHQAPNSGFTADDDPDHYSERYTGSGDNGGVHINSGIGNKAFYLLAKGGTHHRGGSMTGIGSDKAAQIFYRALTTFMTSSTNFAGARTATLNAAAALYGNGSTEYNATADAWCLVGIGTCVEAPDPDPDPDPGPPSGTELIVNGGFEDGSAPWVVSGTGASHVDSGAGSFPHTGTGYVFFGNANSVSGQVYQQVAIPAGSAPTLTFFLNVTSAETTTTTQFDKLFIEVRNTSGTLLTTLGTYSNLNKVATAGNYTQKSLSLANFAGQTIRLQFRATTDSSLITTFRIDDVSVIGGAPAQNEITTTTLTAAPSPASVGQPVTLAATVTPAATCDVQGSITFRNGNTVLAANVPLDGTDRAETVVETFTAGTHSLIAVFNTANNCDTSTGNTSLTVNKANQTIIFNAPGPLTFGVAPVLLDVTVSSSLPLTLKVLSGPGVLDENELTITGAGTILIRATQPGDDDYHPATPVERSITVNKATQTVTFFPPSNKTYGDPPFQLSANASSGLPVSFEVVTGPATVAGKMVTITGAGKVSISASQDGDDNYKAATPVVRTFDVAKKEQTIFLLPPSNKTFGDPPFALSANVSSALPITFSVVSGPATVAGKIVTLTGAGKVTVRASQDGDDNYEPATPVDRMFTAGPGALSAIGDDATRGFWEVNPKFTGTLSGIVPPDVFTLSFTTIAGNLSPAGLYPISIAIGDPDGRLGNYSVSLTPGTLTVTNPKPVVTAISPNAATAGSPDFTIQIDGQDFVPKSVARLNGAALATMFVSRTRLTAVVPAASLTKATVGFLTVEQGAPGGGVSGKLELLVSDTGAPVKDVDTLDVDGQGTKTIGDEEAGKTLTVTAAGRGSVTIAQFEENPGPAVVFEPTGRFFDVFVPEGEALTSLTVVNCDQNGGNLVSWFDGSTWLLASHQTFDPVTGCVTILVTDQTSPSIADLSGTYFAAIVDETGPAATTSASPSTLWPPNGKPVNVTVTGTLQDAVGVASASFSVQDEYGEVSPEGVLSLGPDGSYRFTVALPAARLGSDKDGRLYTVLVRAVDGVGNVSTSGTRVIVPHSQGK